MRDEPLCRLDHGIDIILHGFDLSGILLLVYLLHPPVP